MSARIRRSIAGAENYAPWYLSDAGVRIRMHRNESALPPPPHVIDAVRALGGDAYRRYPADLFERFSVALAQKIGVPVSRVAIANGADEILFALAMAFLDPGDTVLTVQPTFGMYAHAAALAGARVRAVAYRERWRLDASAFVAAADARTRLVILGHPNNPTGDELQLRDLDSIANALPDAVLVVDEVYLAFSASSYARLVAAYPNVVVVGSFSKAAALAGMRVGYAVAVQETAEALRRIVQPFPLSVASLAAAHAFVTGGARTEAFQRALAAQNTKSLDAMEAGLADMAHSLWRGSANFLLADFGARASAIKAALDERGIAVRAYREIPGCLRLSASDDSATAELVEVARGAAAREKAGSARA